jgi:hypothetical protein
MAASVLAAGPDDLGVYVVGEAVLAARARRGGRWRPGWFDSDMKAILVFLVVTLGFVVVVSGQAPRLGGLIVPHVGWLADGAGRNEFWVGLAVIGLVVVICCLLPPLERTRSILVVLGVALSACAAALTWSALVVGDPGPPPPDLKWPSPWDAGPDDVLEVAYSGGNEFTVFLGCASSECRPVAGSVTEGDLVAVYRDWGEADQRPMWLTQVDGVALEDVRVCDTTVGVEAPWWYGHGTDGKVYWQRLDKWRPDGAEPAALSGIVAVPDYYPPDLCHYPGVLSEELLAD